MTDPNRYAFMHVDIEAELRHGYVLDILDAYDEGLPKEEIDARKEKLAQHLGITAQIIPFPERNEPEDLIA